MTTGASSFVTAFLLSILLILALEFFAPRFGLMDRPAGRKAHGRDVPLVGGLGMYAGFAAAGMLVAHEVAVWLLVGLGATVLLGAVDDRIDLTPRTKLAGQVMAAALIILPDWHVASYLGTFSSIGTLPGLAALLFTFVLVVGLINAYNMLDGLDGIAGGSAAVAFAWLAIGAVIAGHGAALAMLVLMVAVTSAFLLFNLRHPWRARARVFMGDAGSLMLGAGVAWAIVDLSGPPGEGWPLVALLWVCAIPAIDTLSLAARRIRAGRSPMAADREHLHHLLIEAGMGHGGAAAAIIAFSAICGAVGIVGGLAGVPDILLAIGIAVPILGHSAFVRAVHARRSQIPARAARPVAAVTAGAEQRA